MRKTPLAVVATVTLMELALFVGSVQAAEPRPFRGTWTSVDIPDGSAQRLVLNGGGSGNYSVHYYDEAATTACDGAPAQVTGSGTADGNELAARGTLTCQPGGFVAHVEIDYVLTGTTLTDSFGVVWTRS